MTDSVVSWTVHEVVELVLVKAFVMVRELESGGEWSRWVCVRWLCRVLD